MPVPFNSGDYSLVFEKQNMDWGFWARMEGRYLQCVSKVMNIFVD